MTNQNDQQQNNSDFDLNSWSQNMSSIGLQGRRMLLDFMERNNAYNLDGSNLSNGISANGLGDNMTMVQSFTELWTQLMSNPTDLWESQVELWNDYFQLWQNTTSAFFGNNVEPLASPDKGDRRFKHEDWNENVLFDFIKQSYLLYANWSENLVGNVDGIDERERAKIDFYVKQFVDALSPSNFFMTNPEVLRATMESQGENLLTGLQNLLGDIERGQISMTDYDAFEVGKNIANTPGQVVFENDLFQLIQYTPSTKKVFKTPLLIAPPWINKFYILDLQAKNSMIKWLVDQGHTVFVISWANPDEKLYNTKFEDYISKGAMVAIDQVKKQTGEKQVNMVGYCIGGTMCASMLSIMEQTKDNSVKSITYFTTLVDFTDPGDLGVFIDEEQLDALDKKMSSKGYLDGKDMAMTFNLLRSNDLIWSFVVNNYLMGKEPFPFDLLYWNSDSTHLPAPMHSYYLRSMYLENKLVKPNALEMCGKSIDLSKIKTPTFMLSTHDDHIAPWQSTYAATQLYKGDVKFVLSGSGHIAGVINPPVKEKYGYWLNDKLPKHADDWFKGAKHYPGSWWPEWQKWLEGFSDSKVDARDPKKGKLKAIEAAPGRYVAVKH